jgi:imidazolonepropionase-like amidohydrolase
MKGKPAFVKIFLLKSEEFAKRKDDPKYLYQRGLDPSLVPEIVRLAHTAGLRVSAHVETAGDFHNALAGGVDDIAHLPGIGFDPVLGKDRFLISEADARLAAERRVTIVTTLRWLEKEYSEKKEMAEQLKKEVIVPNLRLLKKHHVKILVGSDQFRETPLPETLFLAKLGVFTNLEILKMACEDTPRAMFADRRIGLLRDGYEASFLVLDRDPLADLTNLKSIQRRYKQGLPLNILESK